MYFFGRLFRCFWLHKCNSKKIFFFLIGNLWLIHWNSSFYLHVFALQKLTIIHFWARIKLSNISLFRISSIRTWCCVWGRERVSERENIIFFQKNLFITILCFMKWNFTWRILITFDQTIENTNRLFPDYLVYNKWSEADNQTTSQS